MEDNELTYWKNYQVAMQWIQNNRTIDVPISMNNKPEEQQEEEMIVNNEDDQFEFTIDDDLLDFYRLSRDHKANRS